MKRSFNLSAAQMAAICVLGGVITGIFPFVHFTPLIALHQHSSSHHAGEFLLALTLMFVGSVIAYRAFIGLECGIAAERWPEEEINSLRSLFGSRATIALTFIFLIGFAVMAFPASRFRPFGWSFDFLLLSLNFIRIALLPPKSDSTPEPKWSNLAPIHSEHWGQP